ncbi:Uncharacterised protein [Mycobacteroides abscessus subsp. abscessus]|nr:Uncharacterised protein [Mycobacteroides abscessus subsp. abscessus]
MLLETGVGVEEDHALLLEVLTDLVVDHLGLVLSGDTSDEALLLGLGDAEPVVGVLDVLGQVFPGSGLLLGRAHEVLDVVEVDAVELGAPVRHGLAVEDAQRLEAVLEHPLRFALLRRDVGDHGVGESTLRARSCDVGIGPPVSVRAE